MEVSDAVSAASPQNFQCDECGRKFLSLLALDQHTKTKKHDSTSRLYPCPNCQKDFTSHDGLKQHTASKHSDKKGYPCSFCERDFISSEALQQHCSDKHKPCNMCALIFNDKQQLNKHRSIDHVLSAYHCSVCGDKFNNVKALEQHTFTRHENRCIICQQRFKDEKTLEDHSATKHGNYCSMCMKYFTSKSAHVNHKQNKHGVTIFPCSMCSGRFETLAGMKQHYSAVHGCVSFCEYCDRAFGKEKALSQHKLDKHGIVDCVKQFLCIFCFSQFDDDYEFEQHCIAKHKMLARYCVLPEDVELQNARGSGIKYDGAATKPDPRPQSTLDIRQTEPSAVDRSRVYHNDFADTAQQRDPSVGAVAAQLDCEKCNKKFVSELALVSHKRDKHGISTYYCGVCTKHFWDLSVFYEHYNVEHKSKNTPEKEVCKNAKLSVDRSDQIEAENSNNSQNSMSVKEAQSTPTAGTLGQQADSNLVDFTRDLSAKSEASFFCDLCSKSFASEVSLQQHRSAKHGVALDSSGGLQQVPCSSRSVVKLNEQNFSPSSTDSDSVKILPVLKDGKEVHCHLCERKLDSAISLAHHMFSKHSGEVNMYIVFQKVHNKTEPADTTLSPSSGISFGNPNFPSFSFQPPATTPAALPTSTTTTTLAAVNTGRRLRENVPYLLANVDHDQLLLDTDVACDHLPSTSCLEVD